MATKKNLLAKKIYESYLEKGYYLEGRNKVSTPIINPSSEIRITVQDILNAMPRATSRDRGFNSDFYDLLLRNLIDKCEEANSEMTNEG